MRRLTNSECETAQKFFAEARKEALNSLCLCKNYGAVIVKEDIIYGTGHNSPPGDKKLGRCLKDFLTSDFKSDKACSVHAEQRAIIDAIAKIGLKDIQGSTMYVTQTDKNRSIIPVGKPYCTICSKLALDVGISKWVLLHPEVGFVEYDAEEYNEISFGRLPWELKDLK